MPKKQAKRYDVAEMRPPLSLLASLSTELSTGFVEDEPLPADFDGFAAGSYPRFMMILTR